jgi:hypothetical protein
MSRPYFVPMPLTLAPGPVIAFGELYGTEQQVLPPAELAELAAQIRAACPAF